MKVAIVGVGMVGATTAYSLVTQGVCRELVLIDKNVKKAEGEALDLNDCISYLNRNTKIYAGSYEECHDADIIVLTVSKMAPTDSKNTRVSMLKSSKEIIADIVPQIMESGFNGIFVVISNPVDVISYYVHKLSKLPKNKIIGTGTSLDSSRLRGYLAELTNINPRYITAYTLGEHGDSQMIPWSNVSILGKNLSTYLNENQEEHIKENTIKKGWKIVEGKNNTYYGVATAAVSIIKAIANDDNNVVPVSVLLDGEYGEKDVFCSVPVVLNRNGASKIIEVEMTEQEDKKFKKSVEAIRKYIKMGGF